MRRFPLVPVLALLLCPARAADPPPEVEFHRDLEYGRVGDESLKLNLSIPKVATGALPAIVVIHGGGWRQGDRAFHDELTWRFAKMGYVAATIGYRFCPKHPFPAQIEDAKCAVRFLRANAEAYHIDPDRIGAVGFSAGAHLAMLLGTMDPADGYDNSGGSPGQSSKVRAVVAFFGPTDFDTPAPAATATLFKDLFGGTQEEKKDLCHKASPLTYVSKGDAAMLLFQGTADPLVPYAHAVKMADAMQAAGVRGRVELILGAGHGWGSTELVRTVDAMNAFFEQELKPEKR